MNKKLQQNKGFTLIELLVSIFIIGTVSAFSLANYNYAQRSGKVKIAAQKLVSDIRKVQGYAFALRDFNNISPQGGWGLHFVTGSNKVTVFADYRNGAGGPHDHLFNAGEMSEEIFFQKGVTINSVSINGAPSVANANLIFEPPNPLTYICRNISPCDVPGPPTSTTSEITIGLVGEDGGTKNIIVNALGLVDVLN